MKFLKQHYGKIILCILCLLFLIFESLNNKDFDVFIGASKLVAGGKTCYEVWLKSGTAGLKYFYSPLFAVLLFPLNQLPQVVYNMVWMMLSFLFIYRSFTLLSFFLPLSRLSAVQKKWFWTLSILSVARMILDNLSLGQMTGLLVWGSLESMRLIFIRKRFAGAALLALIINIKILPLALLLYLVYKKELKAALLTILFLVIYLYLPAVFIGISFNQQLLHDWWASLTSTQAKSIYDDIGRSSLSSLIPSLLLDTPVQFSVRRNLASLSEQNVNLVLNSARLLLMLVLTVLLGKPFQAITGRTTLLHDISLICIATPLVFPHQGKYAYFYMLPACAYCIYWLMMHQKNSARHRVIMMFLAASFALITLTTDGLIGRKASDFTEYLHLMVYGALCLLVSTAAAVPDKPNEETGNQMSKPFFF